MTIADWTTNAGLADGNTSWGGTWRGGWDALAKSVGQQVILASDYGWATGATAATNDTAIANAIAAARSTDRAIFLGAGTYHTSATIDAGEVSTTSTAVSMFGVSPRATNIICDTNTVDIMHHSGFRGYLENFKLSHAGTDPDGTFGDGLVFRKAAYNRYSMVSVDNCRRNIAVDQEAVNDPGTASGGGNWVFSCTFDNINVNRYSQSGLYLRSFSGRSTGNVWTNIYVQNKTPAGATRTSTNDPYPVDLFLVEDGVFNQLNIEDHSGVSIGLLLNECGAITFNSLHFERVALNGFNSQYIRAFGRSYAVVNGLNVAFCDVAASGASGHSRLASSSSGARMEITGVGLNNLTKTAAISFYRVSTDATSAMSYSYEIVLPHATTPVSFTGDAPDTSVAGLKRVGSRLYAVTGNTYIDAVARGLTKDGSDQSALLNSLMAEGSCVVIPGGGTVTLASALANTRTYSELIGYGGPTLKFTGAGHGLTIGPGSGGSGIEPSGFVRGIKIEGSTGTTPQTARGGATGLMLNGMRQHRVVDVYVQGYDIAFDAMNNCYGSTWENIRALFGRNNVGLNLRTGPQSGSDLSFYNAWLHGRIAGVFVSPDAIGMHFYGGQFACGHDTPATAEGVFVVNKDYLTGSVTGGMPALDIRNADVEGWYNSHALAAFGQAKVKFDAVQFLATRTTDVATGIATLSNPVHTQLAFDECYIRGTFANAALLAISGTQGSRLAVNEKGWLSNTPSTVNGVVQSGHWMTSLLIQSGLTQGTAQIRESSAAQLYLGGLRLRNNAGTLEKSTDGSAWSAV